MLTRRQFHLARPRTRRRGPGLPGAALAQASDYPNRPIRIIVPFAAGGGPDVLTRKMAVKLAEVLGKGAVVIVDNIVGAGGILAAQNVARMAPDGYNLLLGASSHVVQKAMEPSVQFDPMKDFAHITRTAFTPVGPRGQRELAVQDRGGHRRGREEASRASSTTPPAASAARRT